MSIIYILTIISIVILYMLLYRKEEKQNLVKGLVVTSCLLLCYNIFTCVIFFFLKLKCTLIALSIPNVILIALLGLKIFKDKKIQKYYINKMDIISIISIFVIVIAIVIKQYGIPLNVKHAITDASTHYWAADRFYNESTLILEENSFKMNFFYGKYFLMPGAYINTGILFKIFSPIIDETYFYGIFILFEVGMWFLSGLLMYVLLTNNKEGKKSRIIPLIFSIIYMLAYPLNSVLAGFSYLQVGLNIIICIILIMQQEMKQYYKSILIGLLNFGLMFSYYYFAPVVFLAIFIQIISEIMKNKQKIFTSTNIANIVTSLIIPGIFGIVYFIVLRTIMFETQSAEDYGNIINTPGAIYSNFITNILIPFIVSIYLIIHNIKNKKGNILDKLIILTIIFLVGLYIGMKTKIVSDYYYYKVYYMIWIYIIINSCYAIGLLKQKNKITPFIGIGVYCVGIVTSIILNNNLILFDIFQYNFKEIENGYTLVKCEEFEILDYYNNNIFLSTEDYSNTYIYSLQDFDGRARWLYVLTQNPSIYIDMIYGSDKKDIQEFINSEKQYCMIFDQDTPEAFESIDEEVEKGTIKILFRNDTGAILEKK